MPTSDQQNGYQDLGITTLRNTRVAFNTEHQTAVGSGGNLFLLMLGLAISNADSVNAWVSSLRTVHQGLCFHLKMLAFHMDTSGFPSGTAPY